MTKSSSLMPYDMFTHESESACGLLARSAGMAMPPDGLCFTDDFLLFFNCHPSHSTTGYGAWISTWIVALTPSMKNSDN